MHLFLLKLDYCNSLLLGTPKYNITKLQRIQNMSCRLIHQLPKYSTINTYLAQLHWLKMQERITYKVATIMFKCINNIALAYLLEMVISQLPHTRSLRSTKGDYFIQPNPELNLCTVALSNIWVHACGTLYLQRSRIAKTLIFLKLDFRHIYSEYHINEPALLLF